MRRPVLAATLAAALVASCGPVTTSSSRRLMVYEETPRRVAIIYGLGNWKEGVRPRELHALLAGQLERCGVVTTPVFGHTTYKPPPGMDYNRIYAEEFRKIGGFKADAALFIYETSATHRVKTDENIDTSYQVSFYDAAQAATIWQGRIQVVGIPSLRPDSEEKARALGEEVISVLIEDLVLRTCPSDMQ